MNTTNETTVLFLIPVLNSANVERDIECYENKLGFKNMYDSSHYKKGTVDYAVLEWQACCIHLQFQYPKDMSSTTVKFQVKNIDPLFEKFVTAGIIDAGRMIRNTDWGTSEFSLPDPNGNRIFFIENI